MPITLLRHHAHDIITSPCIHHLQHTTNERREFCEILNFSDSIFRGLPPSVLGLRCYVHLCQQYFFAGEAGKPVFFGDMVGFPGTYHKYKTLQYSTSIIRTPKHTFTGLHVSFTSNVLLCFKMT